MAEISIIVPVYKTELWLHRCIDSILNQTFRSFDLILVDDGSPDNCPLICDKYAEIDSRVHVIHQKNCGPSVARNKGIDWAFKYSNSNYITFIDSDDCVHRQYLEQLYYATICYHADISVCRHRYIMNSENIEGVEKNDNYQIREISAEELMVMQESDFNYAWGKLYAKKCFEDLRYPVDISFGEDNLVTFYAMFESDKIVYIDDNLYYYFYNKSGITKSSWTPNNLDVFKGICAQLGYYSKNGYKKAYEKEIELYIQQCAYQIHRIRENKENLRKNKSYLEEMKKQMKKLLEDNQSYRLLDYFYWYEALYPYRANIWNLIRRVKRIFIEAGVRGMVKKLIQKLFMYRREKER